MSIPILTLPTEREIDKSVKLATKDSQLGDGYTQTMRLGINPEVVSWQVKSTILNETQYESIESQLRTFQGVTSFLWSPDNGDTIPLAGYYCDSWEWTYISPEEYQLTADFIRDYQAPCAAFAAFIDTSAIQGQLETAIAWLQTYTKDTLPLIINAQGTSVNAFHDVVGRGGYFPPSSGTSEGQATLIRALLTARQTTISSSAKSTALSLSLLLANALINYFYGVDVPTNPTAQIWLPHWLVNSKAAFVSKGAIASKFINNGHFGVSVSFTAGVGYIPTGSPTWGDKVAEVYRVYSTDGKLLWQNLFSPLVAGTNYPINYWVSNQQLSGNIFRFYPSSQSNSGANPTATTETVGKIVLNSSFTGNAIVVYTSYTGVTINKNVGFEAYPAWRSLDSGEKNHAFDASNWLAGAFSLLYAATNDSKWQRAYDANKYSSIAASTVLNDSYLFKKDTTTTDAFSYPGTQLIVSNNSAGGSATRLGDGWVQASINNGSELYPSAELQNFAVALQMQSGVTLEYEVSASQNTILEIYLSTSKNAFDFSKNYTFWLPVTANTTYTGSLVPDEFIKYNTGTIWHPTIADSPVYTYSGTGSASTSRVIATINGFRRLVATTALSQSSGGYAGSGLVFFNLGNKPPKFYIATNSSDLQLKITDGASQVFYWNVPNTSGAYQLFSPSWGTTITGGITPSDLAITSVEFALVPGGSRACTYSLWYAGDDPEILPYPVNTYKASVTSRIDTAHTFKVGNLRGANSPLNALFGNPGVLPFTVNMIGQNIDSWRGAPNTGYQSPRIYSATEWNYPDRAQQVLDFFIASQNAYAAQNVNGTDGFFVTSYVWAVWSAGVGSTFNTWSFTESVDPSFDWEGYQFRPLVECAKYWYLNPTDRKAQSVTMRFLNALDKLQIKNNEVRCPTNFPAQVDPQFNYVSPHASALAVRAALFANLAGGSPAITFRLLNRNLNFLLSEYVSLGTMAGTWSKSQNTFVNGSNSYKEFYGFWMGEIIETLSDLMIYKDQINYPACSTSGITSSGSSSGGSGGSGGTISGIGWVFDYDGYDYLGRHYSGVETLSDYPGNNDLGANNSASTITIVSIPYGGSNILRVYINGTIDVRGDLRNGVNLTWSNLRFI